MFRTPQLYTRGRGFLSFMSPKQGKETTGQLSPEQQDALRSALPSLRTDAPRHSRKVDDSDSDFDTDLIMDSQLNMDAIRARGQMKYAYNYQPPANVKDLILKEVESVLPDVSSKDLLSYSLANDNNVKAEMIIKISSKFNHYPTNSVLMKLKSVQDLIEFFNTPVENINIYSKLARTEDKPSNVHVIEQPARFNPNDTEAWHGGITAFPGTGGEVISLRNKRLLRQFQPKKDWFDYEDQTFDYTRPEKDMPWDTEIAKKMDRHPDKRYNLSTKTFKRV